MSDDTGETVDLVVPLGAGSKHEDLELRYLLRSAQANFARLGRVWVVGECPRWLDTREARHVPMADEFGDNKDGNLIRKILRACAEPELSAQFVRASDDQVFWRPVEVADLLPVEGEELLGHRWAWFQQDRWHRRMLNTMLTLLRAGVPDPRNRDTHMPVLYRKAGFSAVMRSVEEVWSVAPGCCVNTLYLNLDRGAGYNRTAYGQLKVSFEGGELCVLPFQVRKTLKAAGEGVKFLGYNEAGFSDGLREVLSEAFPEPSRYER